VRCIRSKFKIAICMFSCSTANPGGQAVVRIEKAVDIRNKALDCESYKLYYVN